MLLRKLGALAEMISVYAIDIVCIQETTRDTFKPRFFLARNLDYWQFLPAIGRSGGMGLDSSLFKIQDFAVKLENRFDVNGAGLWS